MTGSWNELTGRTSDQEDVLPPSAESDDDAWPSFEDALCSRLRCRAADPCARRSGSA